LTVELESGRNWIEDPEGNFRAEPGVNELRWLRDDDERSVKAIFKTLRSGVGAEALYSFAVERTFYVLADELGLAVPATYLERFDGQWGCVQIRVNGLTWLTAPSCPMLLEGVENADTWPRSVVFDLLMANYDRHPRNLLVEPLPPGTKPALGHRSQTWLIDNGHCGLWWPSKFNAALQPSELERVSVGNGRMSPQMEARLREYMPEEYRGSFANLDRASRQDVLEDVAQITDDQILAALHQIPRRYLSTRARDLTVGLLRARRDDLAALAEEVFPP
jgi:hypothetical protein